MACKRAVHLYNLSAGVFKSNQIKSNQNDCRCTSHQFDSNQINLIPIKFLNSGNILLQLGHAYLAVNQASQSRRRSKIDFFVEKKMVFKVLECVKIKRLFLNILT